ncbi:LppC family lipoprotein [Grimontia sp. S25]|uniref:LppC family lipoprotein n=1 Tax=Grimontia sedimenti TaxID=2711294 RepID=A0A6M1RL12_9GAMM|nr:penicillin-binding protein activator [Grimontia sedimenti]NGN98199.1 LppC family lipoprotein [Grimontia sedimenti]
MFMRKITHKCKSVSRVLPPIALALVLSACTTTPPVEQGPQYDITAPALESSTFYLLKAETETGEAKADWYLLALKALIAEKQYAQADVLVSRLAKLPLPPLQLSEWQLNRALLSQQKGDLQTAVDNLNFQPSWGIPAIQYQRYYLLKGELYEALGNMPGAVLSYAEGSPYITDNYDKQQNWENVWTLLVKMSPSELSSLSATTNPVLNGWVELVNLLRRYSGRPAQQQEALNQWLAANSSHPANRYLPNDLTALQSMEILRPDRIGVMLPLSDKFAAQGEAIRNGLVQALLDDDSGNTAPSVMFYDTNGLSTTDIVNQMRTDGIQFAIGPLRKDKIEEFLTVSQNAIPTLALNIPREEDGAANTCFFTLSPEQEAEQAALHIEQNKHQYPLVIAPDNGFGRRVSEAFSKQWEEQTGEPAEIEFFKNRAAMQKTVQRVFGLTESQGRIQQMQQLLGMEMESEQRSRRDVDAVYLVANAGELTLLKPFIEVAINPDVQPPKLYSSSRSNNRVNGVGEIGELRGIEFSDVPLLVEPNNPAAARFNQLWPGLDNGMTRLYALGMDAYALIEALPQMQALPEYRFEGLSGELSLGDYCTVNRSVSWAMFGDQGIVSVK